MAVLHLRRERGAPARASGQSPCVLIPLVLRSPPDPGSRVPES